MMLLPILPPLLFRDFLIGTFSPLTHTVCFPIDTFPLSIGTLPFSIGSIAVLIDTPAFST
jgi:hypothetical protein